MFDDHATTGRRRAARCACGLDRPRPDRRPRRRRCRPGSPSRRRDCAGATSATSRTTCGSSPRSTTTSAALLDYLDADGASPTTRSSMLHQSDQGVLPRRPRLVRQAADVRGVVRMPLLVRYPAARRPPASTCCDDLVGQRRLRPDAASSSPASPCPTDDAGPIASSRCCGGERARRLAQRRCTTGYWMHRDDIAPGARPLRRADADPQVDLLLQRPARRQRHGDDRRAG